MLGPPSRRPRLLGESHWRTAAWIVGALFCALVLGYVAICGYMALSLTRPSRQPFLITPEDYHLTYESVAFPSRGDNVPLEGWLLQPESALPTHRPIIAVHGKGSDRTREANSHILDIAQRLVTQGYPVLLFDLRAAGRSGGARFTLGAQEVRDVGGAIDFLDRRGLAGQGVDLLGYSMGGATALLAAADEPFVRAVAEDSGFADLNELIDVEVPKASGLPGFFTPGMVLLARPLVGIDLYAIRPIDGVAKLAARGIPLLVVHGEADNYIPVVHGRRIGTAYGTNVQTLFVPDAGHVRSYEAAPIVYIDRLLAFFKQSE